MDEIDYYYRTLYPFESIFAWLNHQRTPTRLFTHREFAFTLQGDVYLRYNSFANAAEFKKSVQQLKPVRFEIGPVYSARPRDKKTARPGAFVPVQRELVFDIDMTDYDPIRTCCSDAAICKRCWSFISAAVNVLDNAIRDQFGYTHLLWVYSGRRGIHLWISDKDAMELTDEQRRAMVNSLTVVQGGKEPGKKVNVRVGTRSLPPSLQSALDYLAGVFTDLILEDQDCFGSKEGYDDLLRLIPDQKVVNALREEWEDSSDRSSAEKWRDFKDQVKKTEKGSTQRLVLTAAMEDIILQYTYPRLDAEVSKHRNHLLKAPFCIHPKTGRVCVPVDPEKIEEFEPEQVPTVNQLLAELNTTAEGDWTKTSLKQYVDMLDRHTQSLMDEVRKEMRDVEMRDVDMTW